MSTYASASPSLEQCSVFVSDSNNDTDGSASQSSETSEESIFTPQDSHPSHAQNRRRWTNLARMCEIYQSSDRAGAAIATSTLQDTEIVTNEDKSLVIDASKLKRERERCRKEICQEEVSNFKYVSGLYFDGRKYATQGMLEGPNGKMYRSTQLEEHHVLVGEPGTYYLTHLSPTDGKGRTLAQEIFDFISNTAVPKTQHCRF